jgi:hypothetical protein
LIVAQIALSLVLLAAASLFLRSLVNLTKVDTGFNRQNVLVFGLGRIRGRIPLDARLVNLQQQIEDRVQAMPGVHAASFSCSLSIRACGPTTLPCRAFRALRKTARMCSSTWLAKASSHHEPAHPVAGRGFDSTDKIDSPKVAIINQTMAHMFFPDSSPIGHHFGLGDDPSHSGDIEIIGVVKNAKYVACRRARGRGVFPLLAARAVLRQLRSALFGRCGADDPGGAARHCRGQSECAVNSISTLTEQVDESTANQRLIARLSSFFGLLAAFLVCIGIYGLLSYAVARRTSEIGVRMALGAKRSNVLWLILREILVLVAIGVASAFPWRLKGIIWSPSCFTA